MPAPVTHLAREALVLEEPRVRRAFSAASAIAARRSATERRCCAAPWYAWRPAKRRCRTRPPRREPQRRLARLDAAAVRADVHFDQHVEPHARRARRVVQLVGVRRRRRRTRHPRPLRAAPRAARACARPTTSFETSTSCDAAVDHRLRLAHLLAAHADRAGAIWRRAISGHLCDFACGRSAQPAAHRVGHVARLRSKASRSRSSAGVSTWASGSRRRRAAEGAWMGEERAGDAAACILPGHGAARRARRPPRAA